MIKSKLENIVFKFLERGQLETIAHKENFEKSQKDALTGAYSKGALIEKGPEAIKRSEVLAEALSVVTFDIDHFKKSMMVTVMLVETMFYASFQKL
jgi:two-component system cell cycle response regulator